MKLEAWFFPHDKNCKLTRQVFGKLQHVDGIKIQLMTRSLSALYDKNYDILLQFVIHDNETDDSVQITILYIDCCRVVGKIELDFIKM